ncbi:MAG: glutathione S-transferase family protein [Steroidobacteraceae bacterium]
MLHLWDNADSGNGYKVRLLLAQLERPYQWTDLDIFHGGSRTPEFLAKNPAGQVPTLELEDGRCLAESNAILWYLADGTPFLPNDPFDRALVLQWMFFEQYSHEPYVATPRFILRHLPADSPRREELPWRLERGRRALALMESHLAWRRFFVADIYSIADVALYAYTHVADQGGHDLEPYPAVRAWLARVAAQSRHVAITKLPSSSSSSAD